MSSICLEAVDILHEGPRHHPRYRLPRPPHALAALQRDQLVARASIEQCAEKGAAQALTGPIARGDAETLSKHIEAMSCKFPEITDTYKSIALHGVEMAEAVSAINTEQIEALIRILK